LDEKKKLEETRGEGNLKRVLVKFPKKWRSPGRLVDYSKEYLETLPWDTNQIEYRKDVPKGYPNITPIDYDDNNPLLL